MVEADSDTNDGDEELADQHAESTPNEQWSTAKLLNSVEGDRGRADIDQGEDQGDQEGVVDSAGRLKEGSRVVEDEVDTSPLLHHLERGAENGTTQVGLLDREATGEAVHPAGEPPGGWDELSLVFLIGNNFSKLDANIFRVARLTTEAGEGISCSLEVTLLDIVSRRVWEEEETTAEDDSPCKLNGDGDSVCASIGAVLGSVDDDRGEQDTDGDAELVSGD